MAQMVSPLRLPGFKPLVFGYTVNELGNWLGEIALAVLVFDQTGSPLATAALFLGMQVIPALVSQALVARGERVGLHRALPALYAGEAAIFLVLAGLADQFVLAAVVGLAVVDGALAIASRVFTRTAAAAVLRPTGQLRQGNAVINVGFTGASAIGPVLAGVAVAALGVQTTLLLDAGSFALVALVLLAVNSIPRTTTDDSQWRDRLRQGYRYVAERPILRRLLIVNGAVLMFLSAPVPIEIVFVKETLGAGSSGYGALLAAWGIGMLGGSFVFAAARQVSLRLLLLLSAIAVSLAYIGMAASETLLVACIASAVGGIGNGVLWVGTISAIQSLTSDGYQARVVGLLEATTSAVPGIGFVLGGLLAQLVSPRVSLVVGGLGALVVIAIAVPLLRRTDWSGDHDEGSAVPANGEQVGTQPMGIPTPP